MAPVANRQRRVNWRFLHEYRRFTGWGVGIQLPKHLSHLPCWDFEQPQTTPPTDSTFSDRVGVPQADTQGSLSRG